MKSLNVLSALMISCCATVVSAEPVISNFYSNDYIGDGQDRWRSSSNTTFLGYQDGIASGISHDIRVRTETISPYAKSIEEGALDRPYVGSLGAGIFLSQRVGFTDFNIGGEVLAVGEQTQVQNVDAAFHDITGIDGYNPDEFSPVHLDNALTGMLSGEAATNYYVGSRGSLRPFVAAQYGYETYMRAGADFIFGNYSIAEKFVRDPVSGFIQPSSQNRSEAMYGFSLVAGIDITAMTSSNFIPDDADVEFQPGKLRARLGGQAKIGPASVFYGATHLTKEFKSQEEGQTVGTVSVQFPF